MSQVIFDVSAYACFEAMYGSIEVLTIDQKSLLLILKCLVFFVDFVEQIFSVILFKEQIIYSLIYTVKFF